MYGFGEIPAAAQISIIVPLYGRYDFLQYQLALFANDPDFSALDLIYIIDDPRIEHKTLQLASELQPLFRVPFRVATTSQNLGFAGANNAAAEIAIGHYLVLLNSDVMPRSPGWVTKLTSQYKALPNAGALGVKLLYEDQSIQHVGMTFKKHAYLGGLWTNQHPFKGQPNWNDEDEEPRLINAVTAACMLLSRADYIDVADWMTHTFLGISKIRICV